MKSTLPYKKTWKDLVSFYNFYLLRAMSSIILFVKEQTSWLFGAGVFLGNLTRGHQARLWWQHSCITAPFSTDLVSARSAPANPPANNPSILRPTHACAGNGVDQYATTSYCTFVTDRRWYLKHSVLGWLLV